MNRRRTAQSAFLNLRKSQALEDYWQRPITAEELQAEMDRMAVNTKQPDVLRELFETLGNDPFVIAECLARPITAERLLARLDAHERFAPESRLANAETKVPITIAGSRRLNHTLPVVGGPFAGCTEDT